MKNALKVGFGEMTQLRFRTLGIDAVFILEFEKLKDDVDIYSFSKFQQLRWRLDQKD